MKFVRLSLAAIIAAGALSSLSAAPLEDAIKGVEVSGQARYRYHSQSDFATPVSSGNKGVDAHRFSGYLQLISPIADGLKFGTSLVTDVWNKGESEASKPAGDLGESTFTFDKYFFQYGAGGLNVKAGKIEIPTPWTQSAAISGSRGNGVLALYSINSDWTVAGAAYLQTNALNGYATTGLGNLDSYQNLYALAAIGKVGPVGLQVWAANYEHLADAAVFGEAKVAISGFNAKAQASYVKLADQVAGVGGAIDDAGIFVGVEGGYKNQQFAVTAGYTASDKEQPIYTLDADADGIIKFGKQLYYRTTNIRDVGTAFLKGGATFDKVGFELGYGVADLGVTDQDYSEAYGTVTYKYAKNFGLELYYSHLDLDNDTRPGKPGKAASDTNDEIRFQAQYNF
ncbi:MAG: major outer membrane protein [Campylobacteraceae bacterium]|jgi:hypothetical protein|nr:major outer membrane protein [Campylobacteraceae bacterium]